MQNIDALAALAELERRFNGPIPESMARSARLGSPEMAALLEAEGQAAFFTSMVRGQIEILRRRRAEGSAYPALLRDLALYRRQRQQWRRVTAEIRLDIGRLSMPLAAE